jgi:predicted Zn finger-like uncharacterized protein
MVITVTCPSCSTAFPVDPDKIPEGGVNARCSSCGDIFRVEKPAPAPELPTLEEMAPDPEPVAEAPPAPDAPLAAPEPEVAAPPAGDPAGAAPPAATPPPMPEVSIPEPAPAAPAAEPEPLPEPPAAAEPAAPTPPAPPVEEPKPAAEAPASDPFAETAPFERSPAAEAPAPPEEKPAVQGFTFGKRDPTDKAKRLARVLVSDMIMYNAERHQTALAQGTLVQDFEDEIEKSWKEYVEQVGEELANGAGRGFWTEALNDILAKGEKVF